MMLNRQQKTMLVAAALIVAISRRPPVDRILKAIESAPDSCDNPFCPVCRSAALAHWRKFFPPETEPKRLIETSEPATPCPNLHPCENGGAGEAGGLLNLHDADATGAP